MSQESELNLLIKAMSFAAHKHMDLNGTHTRITALGGVDH